MLFKKNLSQVREMFESDSLARKGNKSSNEAILKLIAMVDNDNAVIECDGTSIMNRGSVVECLIKMLALRVDYASKAYNNNESDLVVNGIKYEVKYSSAKGYAHYNPDQDLSNLIFVDRYGVYLTSGKNILLDKCGKHIQTIVMNKNVKVLVNF